MQENDGKTIQSVRYAPKCKSVRRVYLGRITAVVSAVCFAVIAGLFLHTYSAQTAAAEKEYSASLASFLSALCSEIDNVADELEKAEISEPLAVLKIRKLSDRTERITDRRAEISEVCEAFSLFFERAGTEGTLFSADELSLRVKSVLSRIANDL